MRCNAQYLCLRCLVIKGDVPEIGTYLDAKRRSTNVRKYPPKNIEYARKGLFEKGWSISYKGEYDVLKNGSWVPTRVCSIFVSTLGLIDDTLSECLLRGAQP